MIVRCFSLSSTDCSLSLRQFVQTGAGTHRAYPMGTVNFSSCVTARYRTVSIPTTIYAPTTSTPCSQQPVTCPVLRYSNPVHTLTPTYFRIMWVCQKERTLKLSLIIRFSTKIMQHFSILPRLLHSLSIWSPKWRWIVKITTIIMIQFATFSTYLFPFTFQNYTQHLALKHTLRTRQSSLIQTKSGCLWHVHQMTDFY